MATGINVSALTLNAKEAQGFSEFVFEQVFNTPLRNSLHGTAWTGLTMKQQIVFASLFGLTGIADATCARPNSGASSTLTQRFWEPKSIGDTMINCQKDVDPLFKAYYNNIKMYQDTLNFAGSDQETFLATMFIESMKQAVDRLIWLGDTNADAAGATTAGLIAAGNVKFFTMLDGLWKQIFVAVLAGTVSNIDLSAKNGEATIAAQLTLGDYYTEGVLLAMWKKADPRLRSNPNAIFMVSGEMYQNYEDGLIKAGKAYNQSLVMDGIPVLSFKGRKVVNMENLWDLINFGNFVNNTVENAYFLPNRAIFTVPENIPYGTLNESDFDTLESFYDPITRQSYSAYGFTLDAKLLEGYMIVTAF